MGRELRQETRESPKKVDALAALVPARMARSRVLAEGVLAKRRNRVGRLVGFKAPGPLLAVCLDVPYGQYAPKRDG